MTSPPPADNADRPRETPVPADGGAGHAGAGAPPPGDGRPAQGTRVARRRTRGWIRWPAGIIGGLLLLVAVALGLVYGALHTERGTRYVWDTAVRLLDGRLSGSLDGGTIENGIRASNLRWHDGATDIHVSRVSGQWRLTRDPWRLTIDFLHVGKVDLRLPPSPPSKTRTPLPQKLTLPVQLDLRRIGVDSVTLHDGASSTTLTHLALDVTSDGRHHAVALHSLGTPFGAVSGGVRLDGVRPFKLSGDAGFSGKVNQEAVQVGARLSGSLEALGVDVDASGLKLTGRARVDATPFGELPFTRATIDVDHVNPQAFAPGAPAADLAVHAALVPVAGRGAAPALAVSGPVSLVNSKPGALDQHLLPLIEAHANVTLDAKRQRLDALRIRLVERATLTGTGELHDGAGRFDVRAEHLDLHAWYATLRKTQLAGPIAITLRDGRQHIDVDLAEAKGGVHVQAAVALTPTATTIERVRLQVGEGRVDVKGLLRKDHASTYQVDATLARFDPLALLAPKTEAGAKGKARPTVHAAREPAQPQQSRSPLTGAPQARISGTLSARGALAPQLTTKVVFSLKDSVYNALPLTGGGTLQLAGTRILPSDVKLSIAGNDVALSGRFGAPGDRLRFNVHAPSLDRLGFGVAGTLSADGDLSGSFAHPEVVANYQADELSFGANRVGHAQGRAEIRSGAHGALIASIDARDIALPDVTLTTLSARLDGTRMAHTAVATATGKLRGRPVDLNVAAHGKLTDAPRGMRWDGSITALSNRGMPALSLAAPVTVSMAPGKLVLGPTRLSVETALIDLKSLSFDHGRVASAGQVAHIDINRLLRIAEEMTGNPPPVRTDLILDGDWNFALADQATGHIQLARRSGDVTASAGRALAPLGIDGLRARVDFAAGNQVNLTLLASAARIGRIDADLHSTLTRRGTALALDESSALHGRVKAEVPSLRNTGALLGPQYILGGRLGLDLTVTGQVGRPEVSGRLDGDNLAATLVDEGVTLNQGIVRIALTQNLVDFQQVEFHGASGTLRATGKVQLDEANPNVAAHIVADKLELFAAPDRQLSLSGSATVANGGPAGGMAIDGKFTVDHALFDLPDSPAPKLGDDVVIVRSDGKLVNGSGSVVEATNKPASRFAPRANVEVRLGKNFRFHGAGADLKLQGAVTAMSAPNEPLRAVGNVRVVEGSTYEAFGRKLAVENGYFTFNGPVSNPGINILAMRRNQEVEAGVQVTGTVQAPVARLVSEPNVPDSEKLSWLLFGHGSDTGTNLGQQSTMTAALALLGNVGGKRIAKSLGLDEISIGQSDVGLTDPQVVSLAKALNERFILGYEQGLTTAGSVFKLTWLLTRNWSIALHSGTLNGVDLLFNRRFD